MKISIFYVFFFAVIINLLAFLVISIAVDGMAFNGDVRADGFYLGNGAKLIKVSESVYYYSFWHGVSVVTTLPIAILLILIKVSRDSKK